MRITTERRCFAANVVYWGAAENSARQVANIQRTKGPKYGGTATGACTLAYQVKGWSGSMRYVLSLMLAVSALGIMPASSEETELGVSLASLDNAITVNDGCRLNKQEQYRALHDKMHRRPHEKSWAGTDRRILNCTVAISSAFLIADPNHPNDTPSIR